jgi:hypothetical protein
MAWAAVYFAGPLALLTALLVAVATGNSGIEAGVVGQSVSRIVVAVWSILRPEAQVKKTRPVWRIGSALLWTLLAFLLISGSET